MRSAPRDRHHGTDRQHRPAAEPVGQPPEGGGAHAAQRVDQEHQARRAEAETERGPLEAEADHVEHADHGAGRAAADDVEPDQRPVADRATGHRGHRPHPGRRRDEALRGRQQASYDEGAASGQQGGGGERPAPAGELGGVAGQEPSGHPAEGRAADVETGGPRVRRGVQLLAEVRRRDRRQPGQGRAHQAPHHQQGGPGRGQRAADRAQGREQHGEVDQPGPADHVRQRPHDQERHPERHRGQRQGQRRLGRGHVEPGRQGGEDRLRAVEQLEGRQTGREERDHHAPVAGRAGEVPLVRGGGRRGGDGGGHDPASLCAGAR